MASEAERKLYRAIKGSDRTIREIVNSLSTSEKSEWDRIFLDNPVGGIPLSQYGIKALGPLAGYGARKAAAEPLEAMADYLADHVADELAAEFAMWAIDQIADAHFPGSGIARRMAFLAYKVTKVRSIFYGIKPSQDLALRAFNTLTGGPKSIEIEVTIKRDDDNGAAGALVPVRR